jgi:hypothetical protein
MAAAHISVDHRLKVWQVVVVLIFAGHISVGEDVIAHNREVGVHIEATGRVKKRKK